MPGCDLQIVFDRADRTYAPDEPIKGSVKVSVNAACAYNKLTLQTLWRTHGSGNIDSGEAERVVLDTAGSWSAGDVKSYPFTFPAPKSPYTYRGQYVNVDWYVMAQADIAWAFDPKAEEEFLLVAKSDAPLASHVETSRQADSAGASPSTLGNKVMFVVSAVFLLIGLGVLTGGLMSAFIGEQDGWLDGIGFLLFGSVFACVGGAVLYFALRNRLAERLLGDIQTEIPSHRLRRGGKVNCKINFVAKAALDLDKITAALTGEEKAVSGSGTRRTTYSVTLHEEVQTELYGQRISAGTAVEKKFLLTLPPDAAPSFTASDNSITWTLTLHIYINYAPDWQESFPLTVVA